MAPTHYENEQVKEAKLTAAPDAKRCEAGTDEKHPEGSCGQGQPLYTTNGLVHCFTHADWPNSKEAKKLIAIRKIDKEGK